MRRRAPLLLICLAVGAVCLLLWETVIGPALDDTAPDEATSMIGAGDLLAGGEEERSAPTLRTIGRATGPGGADGRGGALVTGTEAERAALRAGAASVPFEGRVVGPRGAPAEGVKIVVKGAHGVDTIETGANGRFKHGLRPGRYALMFQGEDGGLIVRSWMLDGSPKDDLEFALKEPSAIQVRVMRGDEGVAGTEVTVTSREMGDLATFQAPTGVGGEALFEGLVPGRYEVTAQVPEGPLGRHNTYASPGATRPVEMRVPAGIVLKGTVRAGADGPGVAATITLETSASRSHGLFVTTFETEADGTYEVSVPKGGARSFTVEADGYAAWPHLKQKRSVLRSLRNLARKGPVTRNVTLTGGAALQGVVQTEDKTPLPGVALRFRMRSGPTVSVTSKEGGRFEVANLNPGTYDLQVESPAYFPIQGQALRVGIPGGANPKPVTFDITLAGARRLEGLVVDGAGQGVGGARVWIMGGGRVVRSARDAGRELEVFTNEAGGWTVADIPPDKNVTVRAAMGDLEADPVYAPWQKPPTQPIRMTLQGTASLRGTVEDLRSRAPIARVQIRITPEPYDGRSSRVVYTNKAGEFSVQRMLPGRWKLAPRLKGYLPAEPEFVDLVREGEGRATLQLDPGEVFAGVVQDESGRPLRYARVRITGRPLDAEKNISRGANTDAQGLFRMTGFRQGTYEVRVYRQGFRNEVVRDMRRGDDSMRFTLRKR